MIKTDCLILERGDLVRDYKNKDLSEIGYSDFKFREPFIKSSIVLFVDVDCQTKILKNRYGDNGKEFDLFDLEKAFNAGTNFKEMDYRTKQGDVVTPDFRKYYLENKKNENKTI